MKYLNENTVILNVDDTEPKCIDCEHYYYCSDDCKCGPEYGWRMFTKIISIRKESEE